MEEARGLLVMTIEIGDGRKDVIRISESDTSASLAEEFALKHSLDAPIQVSLRKLIDKEIEKALARREAKEQLLSEQLSTQTKSPFKKQKQKIDPPTPRGPPKPNCGERLYTKGMEMLGVRQQKSQEALSKKPPAPFKPTINEYSKLISPRLFQKPEDILQMKAHKYKEDLAARQAQKLEEELKECTFVPQVSSREKSPRNIHTELYKDAESRRVKKESLIEESRGEFGSLKKKKRLSQNKKKEESADDFVNRLANSKNNFAEQMELKKEEQRQKELYNNGRPLFSPDIGNPEKRPVNIFERLYQLKLKRMKKNKETYSQSLNNKMSPKSLNLLNQFKEKQYARIFEALDSDGDGKISSEAIEIDTLDLKILDTLTPIFKALDQGAELDFHNFIGLINEHWESFSQEQKGYLMTREQKVMTSCSTPSFITPNSAKILEKRRDSENDLIGRLAYTGRISMMKREMEKEMKTKEELKECSFKPKILKRKRN